MVKQLNDRAVLLIRDNKLQEAKVLLEEAVRLYPHAALPKYNLGMVYLNLGYYDAGFKLYESRIQLDMQAELSTMQHNLPFPKWNGERNCKLLIQFEQGIGDCIMMSRFFPRLEREGIKCSLQTYPALFDLIKRSFPRVQLYDKYIVPDDIDCVVPLMSLPRHIREFDNTVPYLVPRVPLTNNGKVGIVWKGNASFSNDKIRSAALIDLVPLFESGRKFISLQQFITEQEYRILKRYDVEFVDLTRASFDDTASIVAGLDEVISVDTSVLHLAGALGKTTRMLVPLANDWRWLKNTNKSHWYPTMTLYRQKEKMNWQHPIADLKKDLDAAVAETD